MATTKSKEAVRSYSLISDRTFQQMHASMLALRTLAKRNAASKGAEAAIVGAFIDLRPGDLVLAPADLFPALLLTGGRLQLSATRGKASEQTGIPVVSPTSASSVFAIAAGVALGRQTAANDSVVVAFSTEMADENAWLDALRLAGKYKLPILFCLLQGDDAEVARIGSMAMSAGVITVPVDKADVVAMYRVAFESLARARRRTGATLIVSTQYKLENEEPVSAEDPLKKLEIYLRKKGISTTARQLKAR